MRILIATDWYKPVINGVVTSVINLEEGLRAQGHEVKVLTLSPNIHTLKKDNVYYLRSLSVNIIYPNARVRYSRARRCLKELVEWKPEVIHTQCEFSSFGLAKKLAKRLDVPIVHTYHTVYEDYTHYFAPTERTGKNIVTYFSRRISNHVERLIVPTDKVKKLLRSYRITKPIDVIPSGIHLEQFFLRYSRKEIEKRKRELGIPLTDTLCVSVGRLAKEKNEKELLEYFYRMKPKNCSYLIVGDGPYREELEKLVKKRGLEDKVFFCGMVQPQEVPFYYQMGDLFLCASNSETQGITYIEAMASGVPVLCREDECLAQVITNHVNGRCYQTYEQFVEAFQNITGDAEYARMLSDNAHIKAEEFGVEMFANRVLKSYRDAIRRTPQSENQERMDSVG